MLKIYLVIALTVMYADRWNSSWFVNLNNFCTQLMKDCHLHLLLTSLELLSLVILLFIVLFGLLYVIKKFNLFFKAKNNTEMFFVKMFPMGNALMVKNSMDTENLSLSENNINSHESLFNEEDESMFNEEAKESFQSFSKVVENYKSKVDFFEEFNVAVVFSHECDSWDTPEGLGRSSSSSTSSSSSEVLVNPYGTLSIEVIHKQPVDFVNNNPLMLAELQHVKDNYCKDVITVNSATLDTIDQAMCYRMERLNLDYRSITDFKSSGFAIEYDMEFSENVVTSQFLNICLFVCKFRYLFLHVPECIFFYGNMNTFLENLYIDNNMTIAMKEFLKPHKKLQFFVDVVVMLFKDACILHWNLIEKNPILLEALNSQEVLISYLNKLFQCRTQKAMYKQKSEFTKSQKAFVNEQKEQMEDSTEVDSSFLEELL